MQFCISRKHSKCVILQLIRDAPARHAGGPRTWQRLKGMTQKLSGFGRTWRRWPCLALSSEAGQLSSGRPALLSTDLPCHISHLSPAWLTLLHHHNCLLCLLHHYLTSPDHIGLILVRILVASQRYSSAPQYSAGTDIHATVPDWYMYQRIIAL